MRDDNLERVFEHDKIYRAPELESLPAQCGPAEDTAKLCVSGDRTAETTSAEAKQGAYGKVKTHSESLFAQLSHADEAVMALRYKLKLLPNTSVTELPATARPSAIFCEKMLGKVSRSFAMVIKQLPPCLRSSICVFYLVLRGLDTVEDDMEAFKVRAGPAATHHSHMVLHTDAPSHDS